MQAILFSNFIAAACRKRRGRAWLHMCCCMLAFWLCFQLHAPALPDNARSWGECVQGRSWCPAAIASKDGWLRHNMSNNICYNKFCISDCRCRCQEGLCQQRAFCLGRFDPLTQLVRKRTQATFTGIRLVCNLNSGTVDGPSITSSSSAHRALQLSSAYEAVEKGDML
jgi:hypothetical protein